MATAIAAKTITSTASAVLASMSSDTPEVRDPQQLRREHADCAMKAFLCRFNISNFPTLALLAVRNAINRDANTTSPGIRIYDAQMVSSTSLRVRFEDRCGMFSEQYAFEDIHVLRGLSLDLLDA